MSKRGGGFSVVELLIVAAILGVLAGIGVVLLPRAGMAVNQAERILSSAVSFARFEAIKRNTTVELRFAPGSTAVVVAEPSPSGATLRTFELHPAGSSVSVKSASPTSEIVFNARGVATTQVTRTVTIGIVGREQNDVLLTISGQGTVRRP